MALEFVLTLDDVKEDWDGGLAELGLGDHGDLEEGTDHVQHQVLLVGACTHKDQVRLVSE